MILSVHNVMASLPNYIGIVFLVRPNDHNALAVIILLHHQERQSDVS